MARYTGTVRASDREHEILVDGNPMGRVVIQLDGVIRVGAAQDEVLLTPLDRDGVAKPPVANREQKKIRTQGTMALVGFVLLGATVVGSRSRFTVPLWNGPLCTGLPGSRE